MEKVYILSSKNYIEVRKIDNNKRPVVVIIPGGGYDHTSIREGKFVEDAFIEQGFHTVTLRYRETLDLYPYPVEEALFAIDYARNMDCAIKNKIVGIGFSAGGHLLSLASIKAKDYKYDGLPNLNILSYPVILSNDYYTHRGSFYNLLAKDVSNIDLLKEVDIVENVTNTFPPSFIWHTATDTSVPVFNSLKLVEKLVLNKVKVEYHIFPEGVHGLSVATKESSLGDPTKENSYVARWFMMAMDFIKHVLN